jgi:hypothetical protein
MSAESTAAAWRRRCLTMRAQRDEARAEIERLRAAAALRDEQSRACPNARLGRRHAVRTPQVPAAERAGLLWCQTCHEHFPAAAQREQGPGR